MDLKLDYPNIRFAGNGKLKLLIIVGTRPEIIRLAAVINKCRMYFDCILAHTGQNYDYNLNGAAQQELQRLAEADRAFDCSFDMAVGYGLDAATDDERRADFRAVRGLE